MPPLDLKPDSDQKIYIVLGNYKKTYFLWLIY